MSWMKVDDGFYSHPKMFDASDAAVALWVRAGSWSARNLTDGYVPDGMPARLCQDHVQATAELIDRGVWRRTRKGFIFHDWLQWNRSRTVILEQRRKDAAKKAAMRARKGNNRRSNTNLSPRASPGGQVRDSPRDSPRESALPDQGSPPFGRGTPRAGPAPATAGPEPADPDEPAVLGAELDDAQLVINSHGIAAVRAAMAGKRQPVTEEATG